MPVQGDYQSPAGPELNHLTQVLDDSETFTCRQKRVSGEKKLLNVWSLKTRYTVRKAEFLLSAIDGVSIQKTWLKSQKQCFACYSGVNVQERTNVMQ